MVESVKNYQQKQIQDIWNGISDTSWKINILKPQKWRFASDEFPFQPGDS